MEDTSNGPSGSKTSWDPEASYFVPTYAAIASGATAKKKSRPSLNLAKPPSVVSNASSGGPIPPKARVLSGPSAKSLQSSPPIRPSSSKWYAYPPAEAIQSAAMAPKVAWESYMNQTGRSQQHGSNASLEHVPQSGVGLGLQYDNLIGTTSTEIPAIDASVPPDNIKKTSLYRHQQEQGNTYNPGTSPLVNDCALLTANTFPLQQYPFGSQRDAADQPRVPPKHVTDMYGGQVFTPACNSRTEKKTLNTSVAGSSDNSRTASDAIGSHGSHNAPIPSSATDVTFEPSEISAHYLTVHPELRGQKPPFFHQEASPKSFKRLTMAQNVDFEQAFPDAFASLQGVNPEVFQMPYGTRVISIRTDHLQNVYWAIRNQKWVVKRKIGNRIMDLWDSRQDAGEDIYFLFSVNGSKQYCALAEMSGPWCECGHLEGWIGSEEDFLGTIAITWKYIKNVTYNNFQHIRHTKNHQPVVNMWNGMNFPSGIGREVIEIYVSRPHCSNVLAWPKSQKCSPFEWQLQHSNPQAAAAAGPRRENVRAIKDWRATPSRSTETDQPSSKPEIMVKNWRSNQKRITGRVIGEVHDEPPTPIAPNRYGNMNDNNSNQNGFTSASATPRPGDMRTYVMNSDGQWVSVMPMTPISQTPIFASRGSIRQGPHAHQRNHPQQYFDNMHTTGGRAGPHFGSSDARGNMRGGPPFTSPSIHSHAAAYPAGTPTPIHNMRGTPNSGSYTQTPRHFHHPASMMNFPMHATLANMQPSNPGTVLINTAPLPYFVPQQAPSATPTLYHCAEFQGSAVGSNIAPHGHPLADQVVSDCSKMPDMPKVANESKAAEDPFITSIDSSQLSPEEREEYHTLMRQRMDADVQLARFKNLRMSDEYSILSKSSTYTTSQGKSDCSVSSPDRYSISPLRAADGRVLHSVSKFGNSPPHRALAKRSNDCSCKGSLHCDTNEAANGKETGANTNEGLKDTDFEVEPYFFDAKSRFSDAESSCASSDELNADGGVRLK